MTDPLAAVTPLGLGSGPLGNLYRAIPDDRADATVEQAWAQGVRYFDTAPHYGVGLAERRLGRLLAQHPRDEYVLSTKVGRVLVANPDGGSDRDHGFDTPATHRRVWDFSADGVRRSLDDSLTRLGLSRIDIALLHDPEASPDPDAALREGYPALAELRAQGVLGAIGIGTNDLGLLERFATDTDVDVLMVAGRYTLLEQQALDAVLPACAARGVRVLNASVFNSGLLALENPDETATFQYGRVPAAVLARTRAIAAVCARHGVSLPQAALAFAGAHPAVASVVIGADHPDHVAQAAARIAAPTPADLWAELVAEGLLRPDAPVPA